MDARAGQAYRAAEIETASEEKVRLLLVDAAAAAVAQAERELEALDWAAAAESFVRARRAVIELLCGIKAGNDPLARRVRGLYFYLFRLLTEGQLFRDRQRLADAGRLLAMERRTWQEVCGRRLEVGG